jgi:hypothetical protein
MKKQKIEQDLRAANPVAPQALAALGLDEAEAELAAEIVAVSELGGEEHLPLLAPRRPGRRPRGALVLGGGAIAASAIVAALLLFGGASTESPSRAYGAVLVRFAESTPQLLLEGPGWRVQDVYEAGHGPYMPRGSEGEGSMEFVTGKPVPYESVTVKGSEKTGWRESGTLPAAVRQRKVELSWRHGSLEDTVSSAHRSPHPHGQDWIRLPVLNTSADVDTRAEFYVNQGGPGDRQMTAYWSEDGYLLELRAAVPDLAAFEERLGWLTQVDAQTWLDAMPAKVVKAADHDAAVHEMLKGVPVPADFKPSLIPGAGLTTNRGQVAGAVTNTVACLWFRQWGKARRAGDRAKAVDAERAMATAPRWPVVRQTEREGGDPETLLKLVRSMPSGVWIFGPHRWRLLAKAEGLGCARWGIPVLPWKQRLQRERRERQLGGQ